MSMLGIRLNLLIGPTVPVPVPAFVTEAIEKVEVTHQDGARSGFQITFLVGRKGPADLFDTPLLADGLVKANVRVVITLVFGAVPRVLSDGIITHQQLLPGNAPGETRLVITGEDVSLAMDAEAKHVEHPAQPELAIVAKICLGYAKYGLLPVPVPPFLLDPPLPTERIPVQRCTDLEYLKHLAERFGYVFYVKPGPVPATNIAYWGPPKLSGLPNPPLTVNMGPGSNTRDVRFSYDSQKPVQVTGHVQDRSSNKKMPVQSFVSKRIPMSGSPPGIKLMRKVLAPPSSGLSAQQALAYAQGIIDASFDQVVTAEGELNMLCYQGLLEARTLVGMRGAGREYDGVYYVKSVTHSIEKASYRQSFKLTREGLGSLLAALPI
jgi:hypothetical protein